MKESTSIVVGALLVPVIPAAILVTMSVLHPIGMESSPGAGLMRAGIVLHLLGWREQIVSRRRRRDTADAVPPAKGRQSRIRDGSTEFGERIVHAAEMAFIAAMQLQDLLAPRLSQFRAHQRRHGSAAGTDHAAHRVTRDPQGARDPATAVTLNV